MIYIFSFHRCAHVCTCKYAYECAHTTPVLIYFVYDIKWIMRNFVVNRRHRHYHAMSLSIVSHHHQTKKNKCMNLIVSYRIRVSLFLLLLLLPRHVAAAGLKKQEQTIFFFIPLCIHEKYSVLPEQIFFFSNLVSLLSSQRRIIM